MEFLLNPGRRWCNSTGWSQDEGAIALQGIFDWFDFSSLFGHSSFFGNCHILDTPQLQSPSNAVMSKSFNEHLFDCTNVKSMTYFLKQHLSSLKHKYNLQKLEDAVVEQMPTAGPPMMALWPGPSWPSWPSGPSGPSGPPGPKGHYRPWADRLTVSCTTVHSPSGSATWSEMGKLTIPDPVLEMLGTGNILSKIIQSHKIWTFRF